MKLTGAIRSLCLLFFALLAFPCLYGQNMWTWVHGDKTAYNAGVYGLKGQPAAGNQPGSRLRSTSWTDPSGNLWMFGGFGYASMAAPQSLNDLWKFTPASGQWTWINGANMVNSTGIYGIKGSSSTTNMPGARYGGSGWTDPDGNLWLFGGYGYAETGPPQFLNDLWKYNPLTNEWTWVNGDKNTNMVGISGTKGLAAPSNKPGSRYGGAVWKDLGGNFWMFGGKGYSSSLAGDLNDLWMYNPDSNEWTWVSGDNTINNPGSYNVPGSSPFNKPGSRYLSGYWTDKTGNLWMFGGEGYGSTSSKGHLNDLWMYDVAVNTWTWKGGGKTINQAGIYGSKGIAATPNSPGARQGMACWPDENGNLWLFGGYISTSLYYNDLWEYNRLKNEWTWVKGDSTFNTRGTYGVKGTAALSNMPGSRYVSATWTDNNGRFWLFGGEGYSSGALGYLNDLWKICVINGSITPAATTICPGSFQTLVTSGGSSYQWILNGTPVPGATAATYNASQAGTYGVIISNGSCSIMAGNTSVITLASMVTGSILPATASICTGGVQELSATGGTSYAWSLNGALINGASASSYSASLPGTYSVLVTNGACTAAAGNTSVVSMLPDPLGSIVPAAATICNGSQVLTASGGTFYQWSRDGTSVPGATASTYNASMAGTYEVMISNGSCSRKATNTSIISMGSPPLGSIQPGASIICTGRTQMLTTSGGTSYQWSLNGTSITGATSSSYVAASPGSYSVMINNATCSAPATNNAVITGTAAIPGIRYPEVQVLGNVPYTLDARNIGKNYRWDPPAGLNDPASRTPVIITGSEKELKIFITAEEGCITVDTVLIKVYNKTAVLVPGAFTPDGDHNNDILRPTCINIPVIKEFAVYNRWGQLVYKTDRSREGWDGTSKGVAQPTGTYVWLFEGLDPSGTLFKARGISILIR